MHLTRFLMIGLAVAACSDDDGIRLGTLGAIEVSPTKVEFILDDIEVGASEERIVRVQNLGARELRIEDVRIEVRDALGESPVRVITRAAPPLFVPPDASAAQELTLVFTRVDDRPRRLALLVQSSDARAPLVSVPVEVRRGAASLIAVPAQATFPHAGRQTIRLVNAGSAPLTLTRAELEGEPFDVRLAGTTLGGAVRDAALSGAIVPAGGELPLEVGFAPEDAAPVAGQVTLFGDGAGTERGFSIPLLGNEDGPCIIVRPGLVTFGEKPAGTASGIEVEIESCGIVPVEVTEVALATAAHAADPELAAAGVLASSPRFSIAEGASAEEPWLIAPGEVRRVAVRYTAWTEDDVLAEVVPDEDRGMLIVRSRSSLPLRVVMITASTEPLDPVDPVDPTTIAGCEWAGGTVVKHAVEVQMTADDAYEVWVDGAPLARDEGAWSSIDTYAFELDSGCHVLGVHAWDLHSVRSGLIALVRVDGAVRWTSGDAKPEWSVSGPDAPPAEWQDLFFDDGTWTEPRACASTTVWGTAVSGLEAEGARWVWWNTDCNDLSNAYFRLTFTAD